MRRRAERGVGKQEGVGVVGQLVLPLVEGLLATKQALYGMVQGIGIAAMEQLFADDAERLAGPKGRHQRGRGANHWGTTMTPFPFGGRNVTLRRPRVRGRDGRERRLPLVEELRGRDPVPEKVIDQILLGVSTRGYGRSLPALPAGVRGRGASKSAASRHVVKETATGVASFLGRRLDDIDLVAILVDGLVVAEETVIVALGIDAEGMKHPLGLWIGSTENNELCTALLHDLLDRGLSVKRPLLAVIDGGKGIRKALRAVFGEALLVQRCQVHKMRNVAGHLPKSRQAYVRRAMRDAYKAVSWAAAKKRLEALAGWLDANGHVDAARSLREGLDETLTVLKLNLGATLRRSLSTTNSIENLIGMIRDVTRNVKRWRDGRMIHRWVGLAVSKAQDRFRRIKGHRDLPQLRAALEATTGGADVDQVTLAA